MLRVLTATSDNERVVGDGGVGGRSTRGGGVGEADGDGDSNRTLLLLLDLLGILNPTDLPVVASAVESAGPMMMLLVVVVVMVAAAAAVVS